MRKVFLSMVVAAVLLSGCDDDPSGPAQLQGRRIYAVDTNNNLVLFGSGSPGTISRRSAIQGLQPGEQVIGIDFRPTVAAGVPASEIGMLYGVTSASRVIKVDTATALATVVGSLTAGGATFALNGLSFGVDFNPTVDRTRVHSDTRQNLRLNQTVSPVAVTIDTVLAYVAGDANANTTPAIVASAYTPAVIGGTTSLLVVDAARGVLALSERPNGGTLRTIAPLPVATTNDAGFDIAADGMAFVTLTTSGSSRASLYLVNGLPGSAQFMLLGRVPAQLRGIAIAP